MVFGGVVFRLNVIFNQLNSPYNGYNYQMLIRILQSSPKKKIENEEWLVRNNLILMRPFEGNFKLLEYLVELTNF